MTHAEDRKRHRILNRAELLDLASRPARDPVRPTATLFAFSREEDMPDALPLDGEDELPEWEAGWSAVAVASFVVPVLDRIDLGKVVKTEGPDVLEIECLADRFPNATEGATSLLSASQRLLAARLLAADDWRPDIIVRGRLAAALVDGEDAPILCHVSDVETIGCNAVTLSPNAVEGREGPTLPDGRRVASVLVDGLHPILLRLLASRATAEVEVRDRRIVESRIVRIPSPNACFLPYTPTPGERKRKDKQAEKTGKVAPIRELGKTIPFKVSTRVVAADRVPDALLVRLDETSMRLAAESHRKPDRRKDALQLRLPYPSKTDEQGKAVVITDADLTAAVAAQLAHFDTDFVISFDAVCSILAEGDGTGYKLDVDLERRIVGMRFGPKASLKQYGRIRTHLDMLRNIVVEVVPIRDEGAKTQRFRGPILVKVGEVVENEAADAADAADAKVVENEAADAADAGVAKVGDVVTLSPVLFAQFRRGKGVYVDARYFTLDTYRQDWAVRIYRYLAYRWSVDSVNQARRKDWRVEVKLLDMLRGAGVDWVRLQDSRSEAQARREVETALSELKAAGLFGDFDLSGEGMSDAVRLSVAVPDAVRRSLVGRRWKTFAAAESGDLDERRKRRKSAATKVGRRGKKGESK